MNTQQLYDNIIKPTLKYMGGNYLSPSASTLLLATAAIESNAGFYISQLGGPARGIWQMEPTTLHDIIEHSDAMQDAEFSEKIFNLKPKTKAGVHPLISTPMYACAMARLKYSMDPEPIPHFEDMRAMWTYYKRIYNTPLGAAIERNFTVAWAKAGVGTIVL